jgi:hypothetical protein
MSLSEVTRALRYTEEITRLPTVIDTIIIQMCVSNLRDDTRYLMFDHMVLHQLLHDDIQMQQDPIGRLQRWDDPDHVRMMDLCRGNSDMAFDCLRKVAYVDAMQYWNEEIYYDPGVEWLCYKQDNAWHTGEQSKWRAYWSDAELALMDVDYDHTLITYEEWIDEHSCALQILINQDEQAY